MNWTYDLEADALYVDLSEEPTAGQVELDDGVVVDVDEDGAPVGIEVLTPGAGWDLGALVDRFSLDEDQKASLALLWTSPLLLRTPPPQDPRVQVETQVESPATTGTNPRPLIPAAA